MLSINTNTASMSAVNAINKSSASLSTSMERLATGNRINSSADDAAGKQIANRLTAQSSGMGVALSNIQDATAMLPLTAAPTCSVFPVPATPAKTVCSRGR